MMLKMLACSDDGSRTILAIGSYFAAQPTTATKSEYPVTMNSVPLIDALSFLHQREEDSLRRILIFDSIQTDARFLLHTLALSRSSAEEQPIVWLSCSPAGTERNIKLASKRMGRSDKQVNVIHLAAGISQIVLENENSVEEMIEDYIKTLLLKLQKDEIVRPAIILIDDVSVLAGLIGNDRAYALLQCLMSPVFQSSKIVARGSLDWDQSVLLKSNSKGHWLDGLDNAYDTSNEYIWERGLVELADVVIDVLPLESGFSREAHGRIIITESMSQNREVINYCCNDHGVRAIRMRHGAK